MSVSDHCREDTFAWSNNYADAFWVKRENDTIHTILRYQIPFSHDAEMILLDRYQIAPERRMAFYQNFVRCIQQEIKTSMLLAQSNVPSILQFHKVEQERNAEGITYIYLETDEIWPIRQKILTAEVDRATAINVISRLAIILRDIAKQPHQVVMRGFDINEVYVNAQSKILLGGFFYASAPELPAYPDFLPSCPANIKEDVLQGAPGTAGSDMYTLSCLAWNIFSGVPVDAKLPEHISVYPQYGSDELAEVLALGRKGQDDDLAAFRRKLSECRKKIAKDPEACLRLPLPEQRRVTYAIEYV